MSLFNRDVELIVQREGQAFSIRNLRIEFRVEKFANALVDNRATIRIFNLRAQVRELFNRRRMDIKEKPYTSVFLSAGYTGEGPPALIFRGVVINGANSRQGPDWITEFEGYTAKAQRESAVCDPDRHTWLETPVKTIVDTLFVDFNTLAVRYSTEALGILSSAGSITLACTGRIDQAISKLLARYELIYTIEDDGPFVIRVAGVRNPDDASDQLPLVSVETGLVGTPRITHQGVELRSLLNPKLKIFERFRLTSLTTDGSLELKDREFSIVKVEHFGSNRGEDYFTEVSGKFYPRIDFKAEPVEPAAAFTSNPVIVGGP